MEGEIEGLGKFAYFHAPGLHFIVEALQLSFSWPAFLAKNATRFRPAKRVIPAAPDVVEFLPVFPQETSMANNLTTSAEGIKHIAASEEDIGGLYDDPSGYGTYGIGHLVHPDKSRSFLLDAAESDKLCDSRISKSSVSKTKYLQREAVACDDYARLKAKAKEKATESIAMAKFKKAYAGLSAADKAAVDKLADEAVDREAQLMNQPTKDVFSADLKPYEKAVNEGVTGVALTQEEFDALVSFTFNVGTGAFKGSTLLKKINENKYRSGDTKQRETAIGEIAKAFAAWNKSGGKVLPGLTTRRKEEADRFLKGARAELDALKAEAAKKAGAGAGSKK
jgi:GH24 family phage-related lysozyme (muramidase)